MLPDFEVASPWWPDVEPVVAGARRHFGVDVVVLRLLETEPGRVMSGGTVTYAAEVRGTPPPALALAPAGDVVGMLGDDPLRAAWARPGGVADTVAWADQVLADRGTPRTGAVVQVKTWNLSLVLRQPTAAGDVWCKQVPPFLAHERVVIELVAETDRELVPGLLGSDAAAGRALLADVPGEDQWDAPPERLEAMVEVLVRLQDRWAPAIDRLLAAGAPDWRAARFPGLVEDLLSRPETHSVLAREELARLHALAADLPARFAALQRCGLPETLVHGDFHPGNFRSDGTTLVLLDWGDSGVGHPLFDQAAFLFRISGAARPRVAAAWARAWRRARPGCDPQRGAALIAPIVALRQALVYRGFLDGIEASERRYHEGDVPDWLRRALATSEEARER
jgi:hypothetical protein